MSEKDLPHEQQELFVIDFSDLDGLTSVINEGGIYNIGRLKEDEVQQFWNFVKELVVVMSPNLDIDPSKVVERALIIACSLTERDQAKTIWKDSVI